MNKDGLITAMATKSGLTKKDTEKALKAFEEAVTTALVLDEEVQLVGFGKFSQRKRAGRANGRNPQTGEAMVIAPSTSVGFSAGKHLKAAVNA